MNASLRAATSIAALLVLSGCSRRNGETARDTATVKADSVIAVAVGNPGAPPSGESSRGPAVPTQPPPRTTVRSNQKGPGPDEHGRTTSTRPHLLSLTPSSASLESGAIVTVEVRATGLSPTGNTVFFGTMNLGALASADGRTLRFAIPQTVPSRSEAPPMAVQPGRYSVYVVNTKGTSDTLAFTIR